ncbi:MAG: N-acetylneuraminate synthase family protein [Alphaproteobacteria bacterium]|nr:N-acetylneuraminate synthase family protein [Alphaproteobacteria bacterium]
MEVRLGRRRVGPGHPVLVVAEAGINHNGSLRLAKRLATAAKKAGADCVKFQTHITEEEMLDTGLRPGNSKKTLWEVIKSCELDAGEEAELYDHCKDIGIMFLSTPFSAAAADRLHRLGVPGFKIASSEVTNPPFLEHVASKKRPVILSTGMSDMSEIRRAVRIFKGRVPLVLLQATSEYPADYARVNLGAVETLSKAFGVPAGISDHSPGIYTALGAVARGACVVEKHFTLDKGMPGPDQAMSIDAGELSELSRGCRAVWLARGSEKKIHRTEVPVMRFARESVVSTRPIREGERLTARNTSTKRPGTGPIPATEYRSVVGRRARRDIPADAQISKRDIR